MDKEPVRNALSQPAFLSLPFIEPFDPRGWPRLGAGGAMLRRYLTRGLPEIARAHWGIETAFTGADHLTMAARPGHWCCSCAVFRLALRQTEGLIGSVIRLLGLDLAVPDRQR